MHKQYGSPGGTSPTDEKNYVSEGIATYLPVKNGASAKPVMAYLFLFIDQLVVTALKNLGRNASSASMSGGNGGGGASFFNVGSPGSQGVPKGAKLEFVTSVALDAAQALDWDELLAMAASPRSADESHGAGSNISGTESASAVVQSSGRPSLALDAGLARDRKRTGSQTSAQSSPGVPSAPMASPSSSPRRTPSDPLGANPPRREHMFVIVENLPGASAIGSPKKGPLAVPSSGHDVPAALTSICHRFTVETRDAKLHWLEDLSECREALDQRRDFSGLIRLGRGNSAVSTLTSLGLMTATGAGGSGAGHSPAGTVHGGGAASPSVLPTNRSGSLSRKSSLDRTKSHSGSIGPGSGGKAAAVLGTSDDDRVSQNIVRAAAKKSSRTYRSVGDLFGALGSSMASCGETETTTPSSSTQLDDVPEGHATTTATAACNASELDTVVGGSDGNLLSSVATSTGSNAAAVTLQADGGSGVSPKRTASFRLRAASSIRRRTRSPSPTSSTSGAGARSGTSMSHETVIVASSNADDDESDTDDLPSPGGLDARRMTAPHSRSSTLGDNGERVVHAPHRSGLGPGDDPSSSNSAQPGDAPRRRSDHTLDDRELPSSKSNGGMRGSGQHLKKSGHKQRSLGNLMASMFGNSNGGAASGGGS
ncbi:hypothetical protein BC828DRAFT_392045 [Blastocladiella britannica]|nr:hypothetical protein BC828DRAFT_392045 [Blastocladiella britannica]